jgi:hypothetical protein
MQSIYLTIALAPLAAAIIAGLFGKAIGKAGAHRVTILGVDRPLVRIDDGGGDLRVADGAYLHRRVHAR